MTVSRRGYISFLLAFKPSQVNQAIILEQQLLATSTVGIGLLKLLVLQVLLLVHVALMAVDRGRQTSENKAVVEVSFVLVATTVYEHLVVI